MSDAKSLYIKENLDRLFKQWLVTGALWGAALFLVLSALDYVSWPEYFGAFMVYRVAIAAALVGAAYISMRNRDRDIGFHKSLGVIIVVASASTVELMVLKTGGHASEYYAGLMLLGVCVIGFVPASTLYHALNSAIIVGAYDLPILLADDVLDERRFYASNIFLCAVLLSSLVFRHLGMSRTRAELAMRHEMELSESKFRDLFEHATVPIFVLDESMNYRDVNRRASEVFGYSREEFLGMSVFDVIPEDQRPKSESEFRGLRERGSYESFRGRMRAKDGRWLDIEVSSSAIYQGGRYVGSRDVVVDITEQKRVQDDLRSAHDALDLRVRERTAELRSINMKLEREVQERRHAEELMRKHLANVNALHKVNLAITAHPEQDYTLRAVLDQSARLLEMDAAAIMLIDPQSGELRFAAGKGFRTKRIESVRMKPGEGFAGHAFQRQDNIIIPDTTRATETQSRLYKGDYRFTESYLFIEEEFKAYVNVPLYSKGKMRGVLELFKRNAMDTDAEWITLLESLAGQAAVAIDNAATYLDLQRSRDELAHAYDTTIEGWAKALDLRDRETEGHSRRVTELTVKIARKLGIDDAQMDHIRRGALLHDIGKLGVPDSILLKPAQLDADERAVMMCHPEMAYQILNPIPFLRDALDIPFYHHERWDGTGYPCGLKGQAIPLAARIFAIVDVWDALLYDRPYRPAWAPERVMDYIRQLAGSHFDPDIVPVFEEAIRETTGPHVSL